MTNADAIRDIAKKYGWNHSNTWFCEMLEKDPYNTICTPQQVQYCAGSLSLRRMLDPETELYKSCKKFMQSCSYDVQLAKRLMSTVVYEKKGHKTWI